MSFKTRKILSGRIKKVCCECGGIIEIGASAYAASYVTASKAFNSDICSEKCLNSFTKPFKGMVKVMVETHKFKPKVNNGLPRP